MSPFCIFAVVLNTHRKYIKVMPRARFYLKQIKNSKKETLIFLSFSYSKKRLRLSTGQTIQPRYWNASEQCARTVRGQVENGDRVNRFLKSQRIAIENAYALFKEKGIVPEIDQLKQEFNKQLIPGLKFKPLRFWDEYENFIVSSKGRVVDAVISDYKSFEKHLKGYEKYSKTNTTFSSFDFGFYQKFVDYLTYKVKKPNGEFGLATNTIGKQIKILKVFLNFCFKHKIAERFDLSNFQKLTEEVDKIFLTENEIQKIYTKDINKRPELEQSRDLFVLGCYLGLRFSDLSRLRSEMIQNDRVRIQMKKTGKTVIIPIHTIVQEIIKKYNGNFPMVINSAKFNLEIKEIGKIAGIQDDVLITHRRGIEKVDTVYRKYELISSHTCRRSFCTNQYLLGIPTVFLMKISGHRTERAFLRYIKIDEELAAKKMMEIWNQK